MIHLFMAGAPSQLDLFDHKPELAKLEGKPLPPSVIGGQRYAFIRPDAAVLGPRFPFRKAGLNGVEIADILPHLAEIIDDVCSDQARFIPINSTTPRLRFSSTPASPQPGRPSMGSWVTYGLGAEAHDLPAFIVMSTGAGISGGAANWSSGFLPTIHAGVRFRNQGDPDPRRFQPGGCRPAICSAILWS